MQYNIPNEEDDDSYDKFMIYKRDFEQYLKTIIPSNYEIRDNRLQNLMVVFDIKFINKSFESFNDLQVAYLFV